MAGKGRAVGKGLASFGDRLATDRLEAEAKRPPAPEATTPPAPIVEPEPEPKQPPRAKLTLYLPAELVAEIRSAALHLAGPPHFVATLSDLLEDAIASRMLELRGEHNGGKPFPEIPASRRLRPGRPVRG